ncbi:hypothetical protein [Persephonella sp.]
MGKKLYFTGFKKIDRYLEEKEEEFLKLLKNKADFEYSRTFGKAIFYMKIKNFIDSFHLQKDKHFALKVFNILSSYECINELFKRTKLKDFLKNIELSLDEKAKTLNLFYSFAYFLDTDSSPFAKDIQERIFIRYFLHFYMFARKDSGRNINYQDMIKNLLKGKIADIREVIRNNQDGIEFILLFNGEEIFKENGKSIKTLRKKAYKKLLFYILEDNPQVLNTVRVKLFPEKLKVK